MAQEKHKFFLVVAPGFEELAARELAWRGFAVAPMAVVKGGIEFECGQEDGFALNSLSRIGTRVLMRIDEFRCRDFPKLFNRVRELGWGEFVTANGVNVEVSAKRSRLMNKKRIAETVFEAVAKNLKNKHLKMNKNAASIYVRFTDDNCQISIDTTGEALFKRGYKTLEALAPLRENLAAGLFFALYDSAGRPGAWRLVDPLCGSGTFLTESLLFFVPPPSRGEVFGFERNSEALALAEKNLRAAGVSNFKLQQKDFLREPLSLPAGPAPLLGIANPPYGVRIQLPAPPGEFYSRLIGSFESLGCRRFGLIVPRPYVGRHLPKPIDRLDFSNGGIDVSFMVYG